MLLAQALSGFCDVEIVGPSRKGDIWFPLRRTSFAVKSFEWKRYPFFVPVVQRILKEIDGIVCEPFEELTVDVESTHQGSVMEKCGERGTTVGGDHGKETVDIAVPFFVNALKQ